MMRRPLGLAAVTVCLVVSSTAGFSSAQRPAATGAPIGIVSQPFHVTRSTTGRFVLRLPSTTPTDSVVRFRLQRRVAQRDSFRAIADRFAEPAVIDEVAVPVKFGVRNASAGTTSFDVLLTTTSVTGAARRDLFLPQDGVYPMAVEVSDSSGAELASTLTFLDRRTGAVGAAVATGVLVSLMGPPSQEPDATVAVDDSLRAAAGQFVDFLRSATVPLTVRIQPEVVAALARSTEVLDTDLYGRLKVALSGRSIVVAPFVRQDAAALVHDGLASELTASLKLGQQTLTRYLPGVTVHANTWVADDSLDTGTIGALRNLGINAFIVMPGAAEGAVREGSAATVSRPAGKSSVGIAVQTVDDALAATIDSGIDDAERVGVRVAAELLAQRDDLLAAGIPADHIRLLFSSTTGDIMSAPVLSAALRHLAEAPGIALVDLGGPQEVNERYPATVFPTTTDRSIGGLAAGIRQARAEVTAVASMLPADNEKSVSWSERLAVAASPDTDNGTDYIGALRSELRQTTAGVSLVTPDNVTLSTRAGSIRLQVRNNTGTSLFVRVIVSSPKMSISGQPDVVELLPNGTTDVKVPVRARTNGSFKVNVHVVTPTGRVQVVSPATVTAHVKAVAGLGQLVSITLLLVLIAWWWSHRRRNLRRKSAQGTVSAQ